MSHHVIGFAEKAFSVDPRPAALNIERLISNLVLVNIIIQVILIGFILTDDFSCFPVEATIEEELFSHLPSHPPIDAYIELICGTQIRADAYLFYTEKILFLFFFLAIFYLNKVFIRRISRYHVIIMGEKIERYLTSLPVYKNVDYHRRWKISMFIFAIYKLITIGLLAAIISAAFVFINVVNDVSKLFNFEGVECGPDMKFVDDIGIKFTCHFDHEFLIRVISYITTSIALLVLICFVFSFVSLAYYFFKFKNQLQRREHLNEALLGYELVESELHETPN